MESLFVIDPKTYGGEIAVVSRNCKIRNRTVLCTVTSLNFVYWPKIDEEEFAEDVVKNENVRQRLPDELCYWVHFHMEAGLH